MIPTWASDDGLVQLYCGDCLQVLPCLAANSVDAIVTDPPYCIDGGGTSIAGKGVPSAFDVQFYEAWLRELWGLYVHRLKATAAVWQMTEWRALGSIERTVVKSGFRMAGVGVWDRGGLGMGYAMRKTFEHFVLSVGSRWRRGATDEPDVWRIQWTPAQRTGEHAAEKPVDLMTRAIRLCNVLEAGVVLDPFMGIGTTLVACIQTGRRGIGIEISPEYFEIAKRRIQAELAQGKLFVNGTK